MRSRNWRQHLHSQLSKAQKEAVMHKDGPMMVLAGPGSGKTLVITKRIQYLISHYQIPPQRILVITFTRAAANEMKERFWRLAGETLPVSFGTFHSVFFTILKYAYHYSADNILPEHKKYDFIREIDHFTELFCIFLRITSVHIFSCLINGILLIRSMSTCPDVCLTQ